MRNLRKLSNCLVVAAVVWVGALRKGRKPYIYTRPSFHFRGLIPHAGVAMKRAFRELAVIEACPPKAELWTRKNVMVLFEPTYRVWVLRPVSVGRYATRQEAERAAERINNEQAACTSPHGLAVPLGRGNDDRKRASRIPRRRPAADPH